MCNVMKTILKKGMVGLCIAVASVFGVVEAKKRQQAVVSAAPMVTEEAETTMVPEKRVTPRQEKVQPTRYGQTQLVSISDLNISETKTHVMATMNISGLTADDIMVEVDKNNNIRITAQSGSQGNKTNISNIYSLPCPVDATKMTKKLSNGVLTIMLPKATGTMSRPTTRNRYPSQIELPVIPPMPVIKPGKYGQSESISGGANISETKDNVMVTMNMSGFTANDITARVEGNNLRINAVSSRSGSNVNVSNSFSLPCPVNAARMTKKLSNGVLTIRLPKAK